MDSEDMIAGWRLDPVLGRDSLALGEFPLCRVLLNRDANYPWLLLVPRRRGAVEIIDLDHDDQRQLISEIADASRALKTATSCDKINVAAIGNVVAQLHIHVIARRRDDPAWPKPAWNAVPPRPYDEASMQKLTLSLRQQLKFADR